jgi:hypothetical protein
MKPYENLPVTRLRWGWLLCVPGACGFVSLMLPWFQPVYIDNGHQFSGALQYAGIKSSSYIGVSAFALMLLGLWSPKGMATLTGAFRHRFLLFGGTTVLLGLWIGGSAIANWHNVDPRRQPDVADSARIVDHGGQPGFYLAAIAGALTVALGLAIITRQDLARRESLASSADQ